MRIEIWCDIILGYSIQICDAYLWDAPSIREIKKNWIYYWLFRQYQESNRKRSILDT